MHAGLLRTVLLFESALILMVLGFRLVVCNTVLSRVQKQIFSGLLIAACAVVLLMAVAHRGTGPTPLERLRAGLFHHHHEIHLRWNAPSISPDPVVGYNVYRSSDGGKTFSKLNSSPYPRPDYHDRTVANNTTYTYLVKSVDKKGTESGPSNQIRLTVP